MKITAGDLSGVELLNLRAVPYKTPISECSPSVWWDLPNHPMLNYFFQKMVQELGLKMKQDAELQFFESADNKILLQTQWEYEEIFNPDSIALRQYLQQYKLAAFYRNLMLQNMDEDSRLELIYSNLRRTSKNPIDIKSSLNPLEFYLRDSINFDIELKNPHSHPVFTVLLDIMPDNQIGVIDFKDIAIVSIAANSSVMDSFSVAPPKGQEMYLLLSSRNKEVLEEIVNKINQFQFSNSRGSFQKETATTPCLIYEFDVFNVDIWLERQVFWIK